MSDWILAQDINKQMKPPMQQSEWEAVYPSQMPLPTVPQESLMSALTKAPGRIGSDIAMAGMGFLKDIPGYFEQAKTEVPGLLETVKSHPKHLGMQALAGSQELINKLAQFPLNVARYGQERLNLLPEQIPQVIAKITPEETSGAIQELFGEPQYPGEAMIRGAVRNIPELFGASKLASAINPLQYTSKNIAKNILATGEKQMKQHNTMYNNLWNDAKKSGIDTVPVDENILSSHLDVLKKYKTPREYQSLKNFLSDKSLSNAQKAQSDMSYIKRSLEDKSRSGSLTSEEIALHDAASNAEKHIENNMFKGKSGKINEKLKNRYDAITSSYRENVVPYRYNPDIQAFKHKELLAKELKQRLSRGEFAAKKGGEHPELFRGEQFKNALAALGIGGGLFAGGKTIYDYLGKPNQ